MFSDIEIKEHQMSYEGIGTKELGALAYVKGYSIETNPFHENTAEFDLFNSGWKSAHKKSSEQGTKAYKHAKRCSPNG